MSVAPTQVLTLFRGEVQSLQLTVSGVDLTTALDVIMVVRSASGSPIATFSTGSGIVVDSATQATVALNLSMVEAGSHTYEVWVDLVGGHRRVVVAPSRFRVRATARFP